MKRRNKIILIKGFVSIILIVAIGIGVINNTSIGDRRIVEGTLRNHKNNIITFDAGHFKNYTHIMLDMNEAENLKEGLPFRIINPKGKYVDKGILKEGIRLNNSYNGASGEWKIVLDFKEDNSSAMISSGFASTSKTTNNMRVADG